MAEKPILFQGDMVRATLADLKTETRRVIKPSVKGCTVGCYTAAGKITDVINVQEDGDPWTDIKCPYGQVGDRLWVRETWQDKRCFDSHMDGYVYRADLESAEFAKEFGVKWKPSIFMPRFASRQDLEIIERYPERLQDIGQMDVLNEGMTMITKDNGRTYKFGMADSDGYPGNDDYGWHWKDWEVDHKKAFAKLWNSINAKPKPKKKNGIIHHYESYPWSELDRDSREIINGVLHLCYPNPLVWVIKYKRIEK